MTCKHKTNTPKFSIIMPSYLGAYSNSATNKEEKIIRAVNSALNQTFKSSELIIVSDGCQKTIDIIEANYKHQLECGHVRLFSIPKQSKWSGSVRNVGIEHAIGEWIVYLDTDDLLAPEHLEIINTGIEEQPNMNWLWFNDLSYDKTRDEGRGAFVEHIVKIHVKGQCGTSNVAHKRSLIDKQCRWPVNGDYLHDWYFIQSLKKKCRKFTKIAVPGYCICHVPSLLNV